MIITSRPVNIGDEVLQLIRVLFEGLAGIDSVNIVGITVVSGLAIQRSGRASRRNGMGIAASALGGRQLLDIRIGLAVIIGHGRMRRGCLGEIETGLLLILQVGRSLRLFLDLAHKGVRLGGKLAALANSESVLVEQEWEGHAGECEKGGDRRGPVNTQVVIHVGGKERECSTEARTQDGVGGENRGRKDGVGIDEVVHDAQEDQHHAKAEGHAGCNASHEMDRGVVGPCEPEQADGDRDGGDQARR